MKSENGNAGSRHRYTHTHGVLTRYLPQSQREAELYQGSRGLRLMIAAPCKCRQSAFDHCILAAIRAKALMCLLPRIPFYGFSLYSVPPLLSSPQHLAGATLLRCLHAFLLLGTPSQDKKETCILSVRGSAIS